MKKPVRKKSPKRATSKIVRRGKAVSVLYEYKGAYYQHTFDNRPGITIAPGRVSITGTFDADARHGITD